MIDSLFGHVSWTVITLLIVAGFFSGFIDSVVGGGGLISVPAMLLTGLPPSMALGTNKGAAIAASATASYMFYRSGKVDWELVKKQIPFTFIGSVTGTLLVLNIPPLYLKPILIALLTGVLIFVIVRKDWGQENTYKGASKLLLALCLFFAFSIGLYDGFIGPGTGTFLIMCFIFAGYDFVRAAGNAKILNFTSSFGSLSAFIIMGQVHIVYSIAMAIGQFLGALVGSKLAIAKGSSFVRMLLIIVTSSMIVKLTYDYIQTHF